jgi:hypothetical protein
LRKVKIKLLKNFVFFIEFVENCKKWLQIFEIKTLKFF